MLEFQRFERRPAYEPTYCIEHAPDGLDAVFTSFRQARDGKHGALIQESLDILRMRFVQDGLTEGHRKDGPPSLAGFELGEGEEPDLKRLEFCANDTQATWSRRS